MRRRDNSSTHHRDCISAEEASPSATAPRSPSALLALPPFVTNRRLPQLASQRLEVPGWEDGGRPGGPSPAQRRWEKGMGEGLWRWWVTGRGTVSGM